MAPNFRNLLDKPITEEAKRPPNLPDGSYHGIITKWEPGESSQKKTAFVRFFIQLTHAAEDVPPDQLEGVDFSKKQMRRDYYITPDAEYRLHEFLGSVGIPVVGRSYSDMLPETIGKNVLARVKTRPNQEDITQPGNNEITDLKGDPSA
jgi:hypothetical protein